MPFLEKLADITMLGQHAGDMSATFPAKQFQGSRVNHKQRAIGGSEYNE